MLQDLFSSGAIKSATDFQIYKEVAGLSGLDFAFLDDTAIYHTKVTWKITKTFYSHAMLLDIRIYLTLLVKIAISCMFHKRQLLSFLSEQNYIELKLV